MGTACMQISRPKVTCTLSNKLPLSMQASNNDGNVWATATIDMKHYSSGYKSSCSVAVLRAYRALRFPDPVSFSQNHAEVLCNNASTIAVALSLTLLYKPGPLYTHTKWMACISSTVEGLSYWQSLFRVHSLPTSTERFNPPTYSPQVSNLCRNLARVACSNSLLVISYLGYGLMFLNAAGFWTWLPPSPLGVQSMWTFECTACHGKPMATSCDCCLWNEPKLYMH